MQVSSRVLLGFAPINYLLLHLRPGSHIVSRRSGRPFTGHSWGRARSLKVGGAMWKRHRALNALVGDNTSAMRTDHVGSPLFTGGGVASCTETLWRASSPCKNPERRSAGSPWAVRQHIFFFFFFFFSIAAWQRQRKEHGVWDCMVLSEKGVGGQCETYEVA